MLINQNVLFLIMFFAAVVAFLGFVIAAAVSSLKRNTEDSFFEVCRSMFTEQIFLTALIAGAGAALYGQFEIMFAAFVGFVGYKLVATELIVVNNGDYRYQWFNSSTFNKWASFIISTKTLILILGVGILWFAGYKGLFDAEVVPERILELIGAWGTANGIPLLTMLKGKDMSFLKPVTKQSPVDNGEVITIPPPPAPASQVDASIPVKEKEPTWAGKLISTAFPKSPNKPPLSEFDEPDWDMACTAMSNKISGTSNPVQDALKLDNVAAGRICWYTDNLKHFATYRVNKWSKAFEHMFGFPYSEIPAHFDDLKLVKCAVRTIETFMWSIPQAYKDVMIEYQNAVSDFEAFVHQYNRLGEYEITLRLDTGTYSYIAAFEAVIGEWLTEAEYIAKHTDPNADIVATN